MKKLYLFIISAVLMLLLVSCGGLESSVEVDEDFPVLTDTRGEDTKMNTITTLNGNEVEYNMNTRRIVCIFGSQDVVAFGIKLLAYEGSTEIKGYESYYEGAEKLKDSTPFNIEEVMSYNPELLLVNEKMSKDNIDTLSKVAPVIPLFTETTNFEYRLNYIGEIFGLQESANTLINYANNLKTSMLNKMKGLGLEDKTLTIYTYQGAISIIPERGWFINVIIYEYLGIKREDNVYEFMTDESGMVYEPISNENLKDYEGDLVMFASFDSNEISSYVTENVGWKRLKAVKENRVGVIDITPYGQKGVLLLYNQYIQIFKALKVAAQIEE